MRMPTIIVLVFCLKKVNCGVVLYASSGNGFQKDQKFSVAFQLSNNSLKIS